MAVWIRKKDPAPYETIELIISVIIPMFLIVIGTFGNLISIIVLFNKENRRTSTSIYLIFLCLMDTISLYQWNLSRATYTFTNGKSIWDESLVMCKLSQFFAFYTLHTSAIFLTFVELDRACLLRRFQQIIRRFILKCLGKLSNQVNPGNQTQTRNDVMMITVNERQLRTENKTVLK
ncbi:unnamed protein product [Rotaria sordida]|uniref:G-protein coupled receptors family 1 profile domain-containing protein n=1 Tax=Rotaria sordida TaxID=392033 RepID=A0A815KBC6_9BILA|nr:unnamed protein product [Rotaria sordida]CAF4060799.1 unnamed protein product [Rotaria sordida]